MKKNISKLELTSIIAIMIFILCVIIESITTITVNAATTYTVIFPVNNGCKIAYYQEYDPDYPDHDGIDIHSSGDDTIYAAYAGTVVQIGNSCPHVNELSNHLNGKYDEMGNYIKIKGNDGIYYWYYHLKQNTMVVSKNDKVVAGQPIATMGSSGASSGKHLHFRMTTGSGYYSTAVIANPVGKYSGVVNYKNGPYGNNSNISYDAVTADNYYFKNVSTGTYMSVDDASAANGQNISVAKKSTAKAYQFAVSGSKDSGYYLATLLNTGYVVNPYADNPANGTNITLYKKNTDGTQLFRFKKQSDGSYIISSVYNSNLVLGVSGSNVQLQTNKSTAAQKWILESTKALSSISISTPATKQSYWKYETSINTSGLVLKATYANGSTKNISSGFTASGDFSVTGSVPVKISYTENGITKTTSYNVTISNPFNGEGTEENPYLISNSSDLFRLSKVVNSSLTTTYGDLYYKQTADIDLANEEFTPIGMMYNDYANASDNSENPNNQFRGIYDGDNHKIIGLNAVNTTQKYRTGLFGVVKGTGVVKNLSVSGNVTGNQYNCGGITGELRYGGTIENCSFTGTVSGLDYVGGITGKIWQGGTIKNCYANATLIATDETEGKAGGITANISTGRNQASENTYIKDVYFVGKINAADKGGVMCEITTETAKECNISIENAYIPESVEITNETSSTIIPDSDLKALKNVNLSDAFIVASAEHNDGYPVLTWQFEALAGDVNNDGSVRLSDLTELKKFLVGMDASINISNSDICHDNKINVFDWIVLRGLL